ncbi:hypothetical protein [Agrobacterium cavarae]|uniref:hypothetical protein n=1 Tax=Agrobacterium cavarae TaxID=2528239 RepID=UPI0028B04C97|nr:hypothetical protein [Agrobacterium cavarae]
MTASGAKPQTTHCRPVQTELIAPQPQAMEDALVSYGVQVERALARHETEVEKTLRDRARSVLRFTHFDYLMLSTKWRSVQYLRNSYWKFAGRFPRSAAWFFTLISGVW